jgi:hypothetical protein
VFPVGLFGFRGELRKVQRGKIAEPKDRVKRSEGGYTAPRHWTGQSRGQSVGKPFPEQSIEYRRD